MLTNFLHRLAANPQIYDLIQLLAGVRLVHHHLGLQIKQYITSQNTVVDFGGGTGLVRKLCPPDCRYLCLDVDPDKLKGFFSDNPDGEALLADATHIPLRSSSTDVVLCTAVSHHMPDALVTRMIGEAMRVLKPSGKLIFLDAVKEPRRLPGMLLWKYDRGSYPHTSHRLKAMLSEQGMVVHWESFAILHRYILCVLGQK